MRMFLRQENNPYNAPYKSIPQDEEFFRIYDYVHDEDEDEEEDEDEGWPPK